MKKLSLFAAALFLCSLIVLPTTSEGAAAPKKKFKNVPDKVTSFDAETGALTLADDKGTKDLKVSKFTEIKIDGVKATLADIKTGMTVGSLSKRDQTTVSALSLKSGGGGSSKPEKK